MMCSLVSPVSSAQPVWMGWTSTLLLERVDPPSLPTQGRSLECFGSGESLSAPLLLGNVSVHLLHALGVALSFQLVFGGKSRMIFK